MPFLCSLLCILKSLSFTCLIFEMIHNWLSSKVACATAGEARKWMEAFDQAKQQVQDPFTKWL